MIHNHALPLFGSVFDNGFSSLIVITLLDEIDASRMTTFTSMVIIEVYCGLKLSDYFFGRTGNRGRVLLLSIASKLGYEIHSMKFIKLIYLWIIEVLFHYSQSLQKNHDESTSIQKPHLPLKSHHENILSQCRQ